MTKRSDQLLYQVRDMEYRGNETSGGISMHNRRSLQRTPAGTGLDAAMAAIARASWTTEQARALLARLMDATGLDYDQRVEVLGGALVSEAVRPHWESGLTAGEAHERLCRSDSELAEVVESVSTMLLDRAEAQDEARAMIGLVESRLRYSDHSLQS